MAYHPERNYCVTILYHAIENTVDNTVNARYAQRMMGRLGREGWEGRLNYGLPLF